MAGNQAGGGLPGPTGTGVHPAVAYAAQHGGVDAKGLGKQSVFDPSKTDKVTFQDWSEAFITLVDAQIPGTWEILEWISQKQPKSSLDQITILTGFPHLDRTLVEYTDSNLYAALITFTAGEARSLVRQARRPNGFEAFRMLQVRFNPLTVGRQRANLTKITSPPESVPLNQLPSEIIAWENRIVEYESKPGADSVSESLKMVTIVAMCPAKLKEHLQLNAARHTRYFKIREDIFTFLGHVQGVSSTPMDVGSLGRGKGGKGCYVCGGAHFARAARARRVAKANGRKENLRTRARKAKAEDFSRRFALFARRAGTRRRTAGPSRRALVPWTPRLALSQSSLDEYQKNGTAERTGIAHSIHCGSSRALLNVHA